MNILVCIKQVPGSNKVEVDPVTGVLKRNSADAKLNPYGQGSAARPRHERAAH